MCQIIHFWTIIWHENVIRCNFMFLHSEREKIYLTRQKHWHGCEEARGWRLEVCLLVFKKIWEHRREENE